MTLNKKILIRLGILVIAVVLLGGCIQKPKPTTTTTTTTLSPTTTISPKTRNLSQVKVAYLYQSVTDGVPPERSAEDIADILDDTETDFVFRGFWKRFQPDETYTQLAQTIRAIKDKSPDLIFCGAVPAQRVWIKDRNLITGEVIEYPETWRMALDPAKWNITDVSKEELQCEIIRRRGMVGDCSEFDPSEVYAYFPDITNEEFQELFLSWIKKQIDCGADAIWIDMLFKQAGILRSYACPEHPAVKESFEAASKMVDEIHQYGDSKRKYIYVGTWSGFQDYPYDLPDIDFVTIWRPKPDEIKAMEIDETRWDITISQIRNKLGDTPIFAFLDWGTNDGSPTGVFSQMLEPEEQREFLKTVDNFSSSREVIFVYPIHGGFMGPNAKTLSFGKYKTYDSLAPEFQTYETIKELAQDKE